MRLAFIVDPLSSLKIWKDSSFSMMAEAAARGHELHVLMPEGVMWKDGRVVGEHTHITLSADALQRTPGDKRPWYQAAPPSESPLREFDAVLMRQDPPFDIEYVTVTWLLEQAQREGARVFNDPRSVRDTSEKLGIAQFPQFTAPTMVTRLPQQVQAFIDQHADVILKPLDGMGGQSIFRVTDNDANRNVIIETLSAQGTRSIMAQRYIPEIREGDKRILLIAGKPVPFSLARIPKAGESRGNLAAGGTGIARPLSQRDLQIANALGPVLAQRGLLLVGLDVIGDYLTEVNCTSPTCFREITDQTGFNVAGMFMDALESACAGGK
jgi:glutathione synthase